MCVEYIEIDKTVMQKQRSNTVQRVWRDTVVSGLHIARWQLRLGTKLADKCNIHLCQYPNATL